MSYLIILMNLVMYYIYTLFYLYNIRAIYIPRNNLTHKYSYLSTLYKISCFNYSIVGFVMLRYPLIIPELQKFYPYNMIAQGGISYVSDVIYFGQHHWSHLVDVTFASYNTLIGLYSLYKIELTKYEMMMFTSGFIFHKIDSHFYRQNKIAEFMVFHTLWHFIVPSFMVYILIKSNS